MWLTDRSVDVRDSGLAFDAILAVSLVTVDNTGAGRLAPHAFLSGLRQGEISMT